MGPLLAAVASVAAKFRPPLNAAAVVLQHKSKGVELDVPFRLLNLPAGAKLEITRIRECLLLFTACAALHCSLKSYMHES